MNSIESITLFNDYGYEIRYIISEFGLAEDFQLMFCRVCLEKLIVQSQWCKSGLARLHFVCRTAIRQKTQSL